MESDSFFSQQKKRKPHIYLLLHLVALEDNDGTDVRKAKGRRWIKYLQVITITTRNLSCAAE